jgi:peptidoglycan/LPS O-acetylase OafA/YrhL
MFGSLRFLLAYLVVLSHLVGGDDVDHFGFYAVRGFFVLSGFMITRVLTEVYAFRGVPFWTNRMLRLLPPYYLVCALTVLAVRALPHQAGDFLKFWGHDLRTADLVMNILVLPMQFPSLELRLLPPYWSVAVELVMYVLLWLVISRREAFAAIGIGIGIVYHVCCLGTDGSWAARYFTAPSAVLSFSSGALIYFLQRRQAVSIGPGMTCAALACWLVNMVAGALILPESYVVGLGYYVGTACFVLLVAGLAERRFAAPFDRIDRILGDIAYPLFLLQWLVGFVVTVAFFPGASRGWLIVLAATPPLIVAAYGMAWLNEAFVEPLRRRIRHAPLQRPAIGSLGPG